MRHLYVFVSMLVGCGQPVLLQVQAYDEDLSCWREELVEFDGRGWSAYDARCNDDVTWTFLDPNGRCTRLPQSCPPRLRQRLVDRTGIDDISSEYCEELPTVICPAGGE